MALGFTLVIHLYLLFSSPALGAHYRELHQTLGHEKCENACPKFGVSSSHEKLGLQSLFVVINMLISETLHVLLHFQVKPVPDSVWFQRL